MLPDDKRHGTVAGYIAHNRNGTSCEPCKTAARLYERNRQARRYLARGPLVIDGTGTRRRIHALVAIGWTMAELDAELGRRRSYVSRLTRDDGDVLRETAKAVAAMYERLCMTPRVGWRADRQRALAARSGWVGPLSWDNIDDPNERPAVARDVWDESSIDDAVIDRVLAGGKRPRKLTHAEAGEIVARSLGRGMSGGQIEDLYGLKIERYVRGGERVA